MRMPSSCGRAGIWDKRKSSWSWTEPDASCVSEKRSIPKCAAGESVGIEKFDAPTAARLFEILGRRKDRNEFYEASFQELIDGGCSVYAVDNGAYGCMEIDTPHDLAVAQRLATTLPS